jgi:hypothetical protein
MCLVSQPVQVLLQLEQDQEKQKDAKQSGFPRFTLEDDMVTGGPVDSINKHDLGCSNNIFEARQLPTVHCLDTTPEQGRKH